MTTLMIDWDKRYRDGDMPWEKGYAAPPLDEYLREHPIVGRVLVPGCGYGHDVRLLAERGAHPIGLDLAPTAIETARTLSDNGPEDYRVGDLFDLDHDLVGTFDAVFEHTCFCAIDPAHRPDYVIAVDRALDSAGILLAIFFIHIEDPEGPPFPVTNDEIDALFHRRFDTVRQWTPTKSYPAREGREEMRLMRKRRSVESLR